MPSTGNSTEKKDLELPPKKYYGGGRPTEEEVVKAGIELETWRDPEAWDDLERAFFWEYRERYNASEDLKIRERLAKRLKIYASWDFLIPWLEKLCGTVHKIEETSVREMFDWREKVVFADLREAFPNCNLVIETARNAKVNVGDAIVGRSGENIYRVIFQETVNDQNYCFLIDI